MLIGIEGGVKLLYACICSRLSTFLLWVQFPAGSDFSLCYHLSKVALESTPPPSQCMLWALFPRLKHPECKPDRSPASSAKVLRMHGALSPLPLYAFLVWHYNAV